MVKSELESLSFSMFGGQYSILELVKHACKDKKYDFLKYILGFYIPTEPIDDDGNTILHFVISNYEEMGGEPFFRSIINNASIKEIINTQNKSGGISPSLLACSLKLNSVVEMLEQAGADKSQKSSSGAYVVTATETETARERTSQSPQKGQEQSPSSIQKIIDNITSFLSPLTGNTPEMTSLELTMTPSSESAYRSPVPTQSPMRSQQRQTPMKTPAPTRVPTVQPVRQSSITTELSSLQMSPTVEEQPIPNPMQLPPSMERSAQMSVPTVSVGGADEFSTEAFINNTIQKITNDKEHIDVPNSVSSVPNNVSGGGKSRTVVVGQRFLNNIGDYSGGARKKKTELSRGSFELGRITNDIHDRVIESIKSIMGVDDETARIYKSVLYYRAKEENPNFSGYERALEMEKLTTKQNLKNIDIDSEKEKYEARKKERESQTSSSSESDKSEKKSKKTKKITSTSSETSSESSEEKKPKTKGKAKKSKK